MQVLVLAGGLGTRLKSVTGDHPKALVPVAGRPFIERQLDLLALGGFKQAVYCLGYGAVEIQDYFIEHPRNDIQVDFSLEDPKALLGTGGAVINALPFLEDSFFIIYGDSYLPIDYYPVIRHFEGCGTRGLMCVFHNKGQWDRSNVRVENGKVVYYDKHADPAKVEYIDYGLSAMKRSVLNEYADATMPLDLARILGDLVVRGELSAFEADHRFYEVGKPEGLQDLEHYLAGKDGR